MNIVIFAGGTGSKALQQGLYDVFGSKVNYTIITNLLDDGKSTGECRKIMSGKMLGPSDLRKNQLLRRELILGKNSLNDFLEIRFNAVSKASAETYVKNQIEAFRGLIRTNQMDFLETMIYKFFTIDSTSTANFNDFSIGNIVYTGGAEFYGSLEVFSDVFSAILEIPAKSVIANSWEPVYLYAKTESGHIISDEGVLVDWNNPNDKIIDVFTKKHDEYLEMNQTLNSDSISKIREADIIIFSSGTQWSSLIPTYISKGFQEELLKSTAKKYLVVNSSNDKDMTGVAASEYMDIMYTYLPDSNIVPIISSSATDLHFSTDDLENIEYTRYIIDSISDGAKHKPKELVSSIFLDYYGITGNESFIFDFDDTILARKPNHYSLLNIEMYDELNKMKPVAICSGNHIDHIASHIKNGVVYSNRGATVCEVEDGVIVDKTIDFEYSIPESIISIILNILKSKGIKEELIINRDNCIIAIKPVDTNFREFITESLRNEMKSLFGDKIKVETTGKTTIEISMEYLDKSSIFVYDIENICYVGDEPYGNDKPFVGQDGIKFIHIKDVSDTYYLLKLLCNHY